MATPPFVTYGAFVGILTSAIFVYWQIGRYATPQVPRTLFDERRLLFAYTAGLFAGIILWLAFFVFTYGVQNGLLLVAPSALIALVGGIELIQWLLTRSVYFGSDGSLPFYVLGFRAGVAGLLGLATVAEYLARNPVVLPGSLPGLAGVVMECVAITILLAAAGIQSTPTGLRDARRPGAPMAAAILELFGFLLLGLGPALGSDAGTLVAAVAVAGGSAGLYLRRRDEVLDRVRAPKAVGAEDEEQKSTGPFARQDR